MLVSPGEDHRVSAGIIHGFQPPTLLPGYQEEAQSGSVYAGSVLQPSLDMFHKVVQISQALQVSQYLVPIDLQVLMHENVAEASDRGETLCQFTRKNTDLPQHFYRSVGVAWLLQLLHGDDQLGSYSSLFTRH